MQIKPMPLFKSFSLEFVRHTLLFLLLSIPFSGSGQKMLQYESSRTNKVQRFKIGSTLTYKTYKQNIWKQSQIKDFIVNDSVIILKDEVLLIKEISGVRVARRNKFIRYLGGTLFGFGSSAVLMGGIGKAIENNVSWTQLGVAAGIAGLGYLLTLIKHKKVMLDERHRIRLIDLTFYPTE